MMKPKKLAVPSRIKFMTPYVISRFLADLEFLDLKFQ